MTDAELAQQVAVRLGELCNRMASATSAPDPATACTALMGGLSLPILSAAGYHCSPPPSAMQTSAAAETDMCPMPPSTDDTCVGPLIAAQGASAPPIGLEGAAPRFTYCTTLEDVQIYDTGPEGGGHTMVGSIMNFCTKNSLTKAEAKWEIYYPKERYWYPSYTGEVNSTKAAKPTAIWTTRHRCNSSMREYRFRFRGRWTSFTPDGTIGDRFNVGPWVCAATK